jgi:hypothetical protein
VRREDIARAWPFSREIPRSAGENADHRNDAAADSENHGQAASAGVKSLHNGSLKRSSPLLISLVKSLPRQREQKSDSHQIRVCACWGAVPERLREEPAKLSPMVRFHPAPPTFCLSPRQSHAFLADDRFPGSEPSSLNAATVVCVSEVSLSCSPKPDFLVVLAPCTPSLSFALRM